MSALLLRAVATCVALSSTAPLLAHAQEDSASRHWQTLRDELLALQQAHNVPALVLVILDGGRPALINATALEDARPFDAGSPFRWGSISKSVTALVALEAARRQPTDLEMPIAALLHPLPYGNPWAADTPVRLSHLLELSAGLPDLTSREFDDNTPYPLATALAREADRRALLWPPGLQHSYSNVAPGMTAAVIRQLTGWSFDEAAQRLVFGPLAMDGASFRPAEGLPGGFRADGRTAIPYWHMTFRAFGALNASPRAMTRFLEALLNQGAIAGAQAVAGESVARMYRTEASLGAQHGLEIGYGAGLYGWVRNGHLIHGHGGDADGYRSRFGLLRDAGRGYLLGINVDDPALLRRMQRRVEQALTADLAPPPEPAPAALPAAMMDRYPGVYYPSSARFRVSRWQAGEAERAWVETAHGELRWRRNGRERRLIPVAAGRFRRAGDPAISVVFAERDGVMYLQGELGNYVRVRPGPCPDFLSVCPAP